ncbi:MBL fold metallo-hydrolase [Leptospira semungkisensis]|nr:MBL fold metallo-hydrolase [Leptospira semungkisensis]
MKYLLNLSIFLVMFQYCAVTSNQSVSVSKGTASELQSIPLAEKGPIVFKKILAADWLADRDGLINFKDPKVKAAGLQPGKEPIQIYYYVIDHPKFGRFVVDTGMADVFRKDPKEWPVSGLVASQMNIPDLKIHTTIKEWNAKDPKKTDGVFLTHMHLDHIFGVLDFPAGTPIYTGPNEPGDSRFLHMFVQGTTDKVLGPGTILSELNFTGKDGSKINMIDFFGDQSFYVIYVPGHTAGSLAFLVKSTTGTQLLTGDTCHTKWGWENGVTPGGFTKDQEANEVSLNLLKQIAAKFPKIQVHPGHQSLTPALPAK